MSRVVTRWWEQDGLDVKGMHTADWEERRKEEEYETDKTETDSVGGRIM